MNIHAAPNAHAVVTSRNDRRVEDRDSILAVVPGKSVFTFSKRG